MQLDWMVRAPTPNCWIDVALDITTFSLVAASDDRLRTRTSTPPTIRPTDRPSGSRHATSNTRAGTFGGIASIPAIPDRGSVLLQPEPLLRPDIRGSAATRAPPCRPMHTREVVPGFGIATRIYGMLSAA